MQERKEQELPVRACTQQDEHPFQLWAARLSDALGETIAAESPGSIECEVGRRNGGSSHGATTVASLERENDRQAYDKEGDQQWLVATRRRVRLENERLFLQQDVMRQTLEELRLHAAAQARRMKARRVRHRGEVLDETAFWLYAEQEATHQAKRAIGVDPSDDEPAWKWAEKATQEIQPWSSQSTPQAPAPDDVKVLPSGRTIRMLVPNPYYPEASVGRVKLAFVRCKRRIIRYGRLLSGGLP